jgi:putative effector of murein hydrolase LrgA (UPF0299 family)
MNDLGDYQIRDLPAVPRFAYRGLMLSLALAGIAKLVIVVLTAMIPNLDPASQNWFWLLLLIIWSPALVALVCGYVSIILYPNMSKFVRINDPLITTRDSCIWPLLGMALMFVGFFASMSAFEVETIRFKIATAYMALVLFFAGYVVAFYDRTKNVVIATFSVSELY